MRQQVVRSAVGLLITFSSLASADHLVQPEQVGIDSTELIKAIDQLNREKIEIHSLLIARRDQVCLDAYFYPFRPGLRHDVASCTKTVTAMLVGLAIHEGKIRSVDVPVFGYFKERTIKNLSERKEAIRISDLLTMRSGFAHIAEALSQVQMFQSSDWGQYCLNLPSGKPSGQAFEYFSLNSHLLSLLVQTATGQTESTLAREKIFGPMGISDFGWPTDPQGVTHGWGDLRLKSTDMAKLGSLLLHEGNWHGKQILPPDWVRSMVTPRVETKRKVFTGYGFQIWLMADGYAFRGRGGQRILVIPQKELVLVTTAGTSDEGELVMDQVLRNIIDSVDSNKPVLPPNPSANAELGKQCEAILLPPNHAKTTELSSVAKRISGTSYKMSKNLYFDEMTLTFDNESVGRLRLVLPSIHRMSPLDLPIGLDGVPRIGTGRYGEPAAVRGEWSGDTFRIDFDEVGNINHWSIDLTVDADTIQVTMKERTDLPSIRVKGTRQEPH